jgi:hypothetical protein
MPSNPQPIPHDPWFGFPVGEKLIWMILNVTYRDVILEEE